MQPIPAALFALALSGLPTPATAADGDEPLPIQRIILYRSGVGYFEHAGQLTGDHAVQLRFETERINDILKSMTLMDLGDGSIGPVSYGSKDPLERRLSSFKVDISKAPSNVELFKQLRGAALRIQTADGRIEGTILGVEQRQVVAPAGEGAAVLTQSHVNLLTPAGVRSIPIDALVSFQLVDPDLAAELGLALEALAEQRAERLKTVELSFRGPEGKARTVVVTYIHEMPVWKTSYRLLLPEEGGDEARPTLQGWAIVENVTDNEWKNVQLSLASGRPVSFTMDLYEPVYAHRPELPVPLEAGLNPRTYAAEAPARLGRVEADAFMADRRQGRAAAGDPAAIARLKEVREELGQLPEGVSAGGLGASQAQGVEVGGQFMYTVDTPVTLARQRSAMLPILLAEIDGRKVSIYNPEDDPKHPLRGVELENDTGLHLMPGPISVYDAGAYSGDAQIPHTARNQERLLSYALDLDVLGRVEVEQDQRIVRVRVVDGLLEQTIERVRKMAYSFESFDGKHGRTLLVEHRRNQGWDLTTPEKPYADIGTHYRFEVALKPQGNAALDVVEEVVSYNRMSLENVSPETLLQYQTDGKASQAVIDVFRRATALLHAVRRLEQEKQALDREWNEITQEQKRIRDNMGRVTSNTDLHRRYMKKLADQEDRIEQIQVQRKELDASILKARDTYQAYLRDLKVD